jgi:hypothetical protein
MAIVVRSSLLCRRKLLFVTHEFLEIGVELYQARLKLLAFVPRSARLLEKLFQIA